MPSALTRIIFSRFRDLLAESSMSLDSIENTTKKEVLTLLQSHRSELLAFLTKKLANRHDAEDIYQNLYVKLSELKEQTLANVRDPRNYLYRSANNMAIDLLRKRSRVSAHQINTPVEEANTICSPERIYMGQQQAAALKDTISRMPTKRRQVFLLFKYKNRSREDIAFELDLTIDAVDKHLVRALKDCRDHFKKAGIQ